MGLVLKIIYSNKFLKYHFGEGHPLKTQRAKNFIDLLKKKGFKFECIKAPKASDEDILLVHSKYYLSYLKELLRRGGGYLSVDTPVNKDNFESSYYMVGGSIKAAELSLKGETVINLQGGMHHAGTNDSSGFCIFNDHAIAIRRLQRKKIIKKACVLDLDVHAGNGTQEIFYEDPTVLTISIHQDPVDFYPGTGFSEQRGKGKGKGYNLNFPLASGTDEKEYLPVLDSALKAVRNYNPDILFVVLGVDTYKNDPLAEFKLDERTYGKIAKRLKSFFPKVILFAGGYSYKVPELWYIFVDNL